MILYVIIKKGGRKILPPLEGFSNLDEPNFEVGYLSRTSPPARINRREGFIK